MKLNRSSVAIGNQTVPLLPSSADIRSYTAALAGQFSLKNEDDAFVVLDLGHLVHQHRKWYEHLSRVTPYYAVKCNNDPTLMAALVKMGLRFDCASKGEIAQVLSFGVTSDRIIFANTCKSRSHVRYATQNGIDLFTFDNDQELYKIKDINPKASFHVGSICRDPSAYDDAIAHAYRLFKLGADFGHKMDILDLGGGYPGYDDDVISFKEIANVINRALEEYFPVGCGTRVIAEPGRFYAASTSMSCVNVIAKSELCASKVTKQAEDAGKRGFMYYVNDGVYGSFTHVLYHDVIPIAQPLRQGDGEDEDMFYCSIWGPTCDSMDCIYKVTEQPELEIGDWLTFDNCGAYTISTHTEFNGFGKPETFYYVREDDWQIMKSLFGTTSVDETACGVDEISFDVESKVPRNESSCSFDTVSSESIDAPDSCSEISE